jgi:hypothetical protein
MSRRHGTLDFTGGMNDVTPAHLLRDNQAGLIQNLYLDKDGIWKDISDPSVMLDLSATHLANAIRVVYWKPTRVPADCIDDFVYVVFCSDGVVKLVYRGAGELAIFAIDVKARWLFNDASTQQAQFAFDDYQFVWVDGRNNNVARRVIIDSNGVIVPSSIGIPHPASKAEIVSLRFSDKQDDGMAIERGKLLLACYTYINDQAEESNPSPVVVIDGIQYQAKGYYTKDGELYSYPISGGEYVYDHNRIGSIESLVLRVPIDTVSAKRVNVYVAEADYAESPAPPSSFRLIASRVIPSGATTVNVTVAARPSVLNVSYENDLAPKGDAIALVDGVTFIGNAVSSLGLPYKASRVWAITLSNVNKGNYVNRWMRLDLFDEAGLAPVGAEVLTGLTDWAAENKSLFRMMDSDLTTPLELYHYPIDQVINIHKQIHMPSEGSTQSTLTFGSGQAQVKLTSTAYGASTNDLSIETRYGTTSGYILCDPTNGNRIILISTLDVHSISVELVAPVGTGSLTVSCNLSQEGTNEIVITPASVDGASTSTAFEIMQAIANAFETSGGVLNDIISDVYSFAEKDDFDNDLVLPGGYPVVYFGAGQPIVGYSGLSKLIVYLAFVSSTSGGRLISSAAQVAAAINNLPESIRAMTAEVVDDPGFGIVQIMAETNLSGGSGIDVPAPTSEIQTRMLSWIRTPIVNAHQEKTIYLVKFLEEPVTVEHPFIELIPSGTPGSGQMLINDFYSEKIIHNSIADDGVLIAEKPDAPSFLQGYDPNSANAIRNAANLYFLTRERSENTNVYQTTMTMFDEMIRDGLFDARAIYTLAGLFVGPGGLQPYTTNFAKTGVPFPLSGHACVRVELPSAGVVGNHLILGIGTITGENPDVPRIELRINLATSAGLIRYRDTGSGGTYTDVIPESLDMSDLSWDQGDQLVAILSWEINSMYSESATIYAGLMINGVCRFAEIVAQIAPDMEKKCCLTHLQLWRADPTYELAFQSCLMMRSGTAIKNEWQAINVIRFLPLFPTDGIGVYDEFVLNEDSSISAVNKNVQFDVLVQQEDTRPGRIKWGRYGSMPDLNEYAINENIMGLAPIKSFQPTDEHNTILVFTKNNTALLALLGDSAQSCTVTRQLNGVGLVNRKAICVTNAGVAWASQQGIMHISPEGISNLSRGIIDTSHIIMLAYDNNHNWIWARGSFGGSEITYVYQLDERVWWKYIGSVSPDDFLGCINDQNGWISYANRVMYKTSSTLHDVDGAYPTLIKTRAVSMVKKLGRVSLIGSLTNENYRLKARMFSNRISGVSTETAEFVTAMNSKTSIPGVSADYVQLDLKGVNNIVAVAIEYEDGVR